MEIDDILEILFDGNEEEIKSIIEDVSYEFTRDLESYTVKYKDEVVRGNKCVYKPNCIDIYGHKYNLKIKELDV